MNLAEIAFMAKLKGDIEQAKKLTRQAFEKENQAAQLIANQIDAEPTCSVLHRSAASLAIECGEFHIAENLIATAYPGNPPQEIVEELKDLQYSMSITNK
ncbi:MAG: hypothetical protein ACFB02_01185 [Mastigocoleus sp.]|mgnify:CR=1 FL=1